MCDTESGYSPLYADHCAACHCVSVLPGAAPAAAAASCRASHKAPLCAAPTTVFYHHLLRKEAQEGGDK